MAIIQDIPVDVWLEICRNLSLKSLCRLQAVCKGFRPIVNNRAVWLSALIDLMAVKHSACSREDVEKMSTSELRDEAARILRVDRAFRSPKLPHQKVTTPIEFVPSERIDVALLPRGERLLVIRKYGDLAIYDIATGAEIVSCLRPENANLSEASHTDLYGLYPTSSHNGYIAVIATDHDADHGPEWEAESVISRELRVYKYSLHELSHVLTDQQDPLDTELCLHLSREEGTTSIRVTRLYLPDPSNKRLIAVSTQIIDEGGHKEKETAHFLRGDHDPNESDSSLELLSPDFVLIRSERREGHGSMLLIDIARASKSTEPPALLQPVYSGEIDSPWWLVGKCVVDNTSRRSPLPCSVRVLLLTPRRLYVIHITRTTSVNCTDISQGSLPITTLLTVPEALVRMQGGLDHGLICMQRPPRRRPRRDPLEGEKYTRTGLWSYTVDYPQAQGSRIKSPGNMRLESTSRIFAPQMLIGDRNESIEAQSMEFRVDPVSGRFVQFAGLPSGRSAQSAMRTRKVDLYVLGDEMV